MPACPSHNLTRLLGLRTSRESRMPRNCLGRRTLAQIRALGSWTRRPNPLRTAFDITICFIMLCKTYKMADIYIVYKALWRRTKYISAFGTGFGYGGREYKACPFAQAAWSAKAFRTSGNFAFSLLLIEKGAPTVAIGSYLQVLFVLGLENDFLLLAKDDVLGRKIQDVGLVVKKRAPKEKKQWAPKKKFLSTPIPIILGYSDGTGTSDGASYIELAEFINATISPLTCAKCGPA